jgi:hypothetical protein
MLKKNFIRDGNRRIIGSVTTGYSDTSSLVRDEHNKINGRTNDKFQTTRDACFPALSVSSIATSASFDPGEGFKDRSCGVTCAFK